MLCLKRARFFFRIYILEAHYGLLRSAWYTLDMITRPLRVRFWRWKGVYPPHQPYRERDE